MRARPQRLLALALLSSLALPSVAVAGPWLPGRWHFYAQLRQSAIFATERYDAAGDTQPIRLVLADGSLARTSYREALTDVFMELGLAARLSVLADFRLLGAIEQPVDGAGNTRSAVGVSDLWIATKLLLFDDEFTAAVQAGLTLPLGSATTAIPIGPGDLRADFLLLVGKLFQHPAIYLSAELGARLHSHARTTDPEHPGMTHEVQYSNELRFAVVGGYSYSVRRALCEALGFALKIEGGYALDLPIEDNLGLLTATAPSYLKLGPEVTWTPRPGLYVTLGGHYFVLGRALPALGEVALSVGVSR